MARMKMMLLRALRTKVTQTSYPDCVENDRSIFLKGKENMLMNLEGEDKLYFI